jgi:hypothetical protein
MQRGFRAAGIPARLQAFEAHGSDAVCHLQEIPDGEGAEIDEEG